jgi:phosphoribosylformylglycinamidine cyclo-ligase
MNDLSGTYAQAGVDVAAGDRAVELLKERLQGTYGDAVIGGLGGFAAVYEARALRDMRSPLLVTATDGVGTKTEIARMLGEHRTIGLDLVAMIADDVVTTGAQPLFMTDYLAVGKVVPEVVASIVAGVQDGCAQVGCLLVGGETAEHPGLMAPDAFDLAGAMTAVVEREDLLSPSKVQVGDVLLALGASGIHANGMSLARHVVFEKCRLSIDDDWPGLGKSVGEVLITPTLIYADVLLRLLQAHPGVVHAMAHITGGGLAANLVRVLPAGVAARVDRGTWALPPFFASLAELGGVAEAEMEKTFNQGVGMVLVVAESATAPVQQFLVGAGLKAWQAGVVEAAGGEGATVEPSVELVGKYPS